MSRKITVTKAQFVTSAVNPSQYPTILKPIVVFTGRSNVGKSTMINAITNRKGLAYASRTPGRTQTINFYDITLKISQDDDFVYDSVHFVESVVYKSFYLVDLPGYGYSVAPLHERKKQAAFIDTFLAGYNNIILACLLLDIRREPSDLDLEMFHRLKNYNLNLLLVPTKTDKISKNNVKRKLLSLQAAFQIKSTEEEGRGIREKGIREILLDEVVGNKPAILSLTG